MNIDEQLVQSIAKTARLALTKDEVKKFTPQLSAVLSAFSKLKEVNTDGIEPAFLPIAVSDHTREDQPGKCLSQEQALSLSTHKQNGYFKGPKAIEK